MTRTSIHEYAAALRGRYSQAGKRERGAILSEFCRTTGYHRKAAIRLLAHAPKQPSKERRGRRREYDSEVTRALRVAWEATGHVGSKRLAPFLAELVPLLERQRELVITSATRERLLRISPATVDRLLKPFRIRGLRRPYTSARSHSMLKAKIPVRTFTDWDDAGVGYMEVDLVAHCGDSPEGFFLHTLVAVDIRTGWSECIPVWGKGEDEVRASVQRLRSQVPFPLLGIDSDNGGEFINRQLYEYCRDHGIQFTRSRPYKKNDQAYVEQKNWSAVRKLVGWDRYASEAAYRQLQRVYELTTVHMNHFQPLCKLVHKERVGAHVRKRYDRAQTPFRRLLAAGTLHRIQERELLESYRRLNPVQLRAQLDEALEALWKLVERRPVLTGAAARARAEAEKLQGRKGTGDPPMQSDTPSVTVPSEATIPLR